MEYHKPVLLQKSIQGLNIRPDGIYVDLTYGGGGHSREILKHIKKGKLIAFDQDSEAEENAISDKRFLFIRSNFRFFHNFLRYNDVGEVDGIIADLGVSSHHFDDPDRGFSFRYSGMLDMRMDQSATVDARAILADYDEHALMKMFMEYGELPNARKVSRLISKHRKTSPIETIDQVKEILKPCYNPNTEHKFLARVFQAIRIEVNNEINVLQEMLLQTLNALKTGGRLVIISYHSLEDRLVKNFIRAGNTKGEVSQDLYGNYSAPFKMVNKKVIVPEKTEIEENPRARSAKLRIAEKV